MSRPDQRLRGEGPWRRTREVLWVVAILVLVFLLGISIAPDRLRAAIPRIMALIWPIKWSRPVEVASVADSPAAGNPRTSHTPADSTPLPSSSFPPDKRDPATKNDRRYSRTFQSVAATGDGTIEISSIKSNVVRSPEYLLLSGTAKPFVPQPWIQISVTFSTLRDFERLAVFYAVRNGNTVFNDAIVYEHLPKMDNAVAVAYLVPARTRSIWTGGLWDSFQGFEITFLERGAVQAIEKQGRSMSTAETYEEGFLRPRSLTPFAPLAWDAFVPDSGYADGRDLGEAPTGPALTKTSPGK